MLLPLLLVALLDTGDAPDPRRGEDPNAPRGYRFFGDGLADIGDLDGDGLDEFTVADSWGSEPATVWILSGADAHEVARLTAPESGRSFGSRIFRIPDVDHDGIDEIGVGAPAGWESRQPDVVYVYSGRTRALLQTFVPPFGVEQTGGNVCTLGDIDGDGVPDIVQGDPSAGLFFGTVACRSGRTGKVLWDEPAWPSWRNVELSNMGARIAVIGDFDRDGVRDFIWGPDNSGNGSPGLVFISSGKTGRALEVFARGPGLSVLRLGPKG